MSVPSMPEIFPKSTESVVVALVVAVVVVVDETAPTQAGLLAVAVAVAYPIRRTRSTMMPPAVYAYLWLHHAPTSWTTPFSL